jgi:hypothetical protein
MENCVRVTYKLTKANRDKLIRECQRRQLVEGTYVPPARIVNELLAALPDTQSAGAARPKRTLAAG